MKKMWKALGSATLAALLAFSGMSGMKAQAAVDVDSLADGTAYLSINNADWSDFDAEYTNAEITGDGEYTVSMVASEAQDLAQFNALQVKNGESVLGNGSILTVTEIKLNGEAIELQGDSYTCSADGAGIDTRVNLYNEWNSPVDDAGVVAEDVRAAVDPATTTAMLWTSEQLTGVSSVEVTFTVSNFGAVKEAAAGAAGDYVLAEDAGRAYLNINNADWAEFEKETVEAQVTGDGTYTVSMTMKEAQNLAQFNALEIADGEHYMGNACVVTIDEIKLNGEAIELQGDSYTCSADGAGIITRVNLYNEWNAPIDADGVVAADVRAAGDPAAATAMLWTAEQLEGVSSVEVTFTVSGFGTFKEAAAEEEAAPAPQVDLDGSYHGYIGLQGPKFTFRDAYENETTGFGTDFFGQMTFQGDTAEKSSVPATFIDVDIDGNGTYTVGASGIEWPADEFADQDYMNLIFLSTDIPNTGAITISDVSLLVDGRQVEINPVVEEETKYVQVMVQNVWKDEIKTIGYYGVPFSEISLTFKVSGFNYDNPAVESVINAETTTAEPAETPAEPAPAEPAVEEKSSNTGLIVGICAAVVAIGAGCGIFVAKKKKK